MRDVSRGTCLNNQISRWAVVALIALSAACKPTQNVPSKGAATGPPPGTPRNILVSWAANTESAVNSAGGGYKVYYSTTPVDVSTATAIDLPFGSTAFAGRSVKLLSQPSGTYYFKVLAYSSLNTAGNLSTQLTVTIP